MSKFQHGGEMVYKDKRLKPLRLGTKVREGTDPASKKQQPPRRWLAVPIAQRRLARKAGARWDPQAGMWWCSLKVSPERVRQWLRPEDPARQELFAAEQPKPEPGVRRGVAPKRWLDVPEAEHGEAKAVGVQWDKLAKRWWAPMGISLRLVGKWLQPSDPAGGAL